MQSGDHLATSQGNLPIVHLILCGLVLLAFTATASAKTKALPFQGYLVGEVWFTPDPESPSPIDLWSDSSGAGTSRTSARRS